MVNRKGKIGRFTPNRNESVGNKIKIDIEILKSMKYKFRSDSELKAYFEKIIDKLKVNIKKWW